MSLFLLSQVFLIVSHGPLVHTLAAVILKSDANIIETGASKILEEYADERSANTIAFAPPQVSLEKSLESLNEIAMSEMQVKHEEGSKDTKQLAEKRSEENLVNIDVPSTSAASTKKNCQLQSSIPCETDETDVQHLNVTDEEKEQRLALESPLTSQAPTSNAVKISLTKKPFFETIINSLHCAENDYATLFALCLLYALSSNQVCTREIFNELSCIQSILLYLGR